MHYDIVNLAKKANEYVFLIAWVHSENRELYFEFGNRQEWFRYASQGYSFVGKTTTVCVYPPVYGQSRVLDEEHAKRAAIAYMTGNYRRIEIGLADRSQ